MCRVNYDDIELSLYDMQGKLVAQDILRKGSTLWYLDTEGCIMDNMY